jgi:hypothetical protein
MMLALTSSQGIVVAGIGLAPHRGAVAVSGRRAGMPGAASEAMRRVRGRRPRDRSSTSCRTGVLLVVFFVIGRYLDRPTTALDQEEALPPLDHKGRAVLLSPRRTRAASGASAVTAPS